MVEPQISLQALSKSRRPLRLAVRRRQQLRQQLQQQLQQEQAWQEQARAAVSRVAKTILSLGFLHFMIIVGAGGEGPVGQVSRVGSSLADDGVSQGGTATIVRDTTTGATALATSVLATALASAPSMMATTGHGVDLRNVSTQHTSGGILLAESYLPRKWLVPEGGRLADQCSDEAVLRYGAATTSQTSTLFPAAKVTVEHLGLNCSCRSRGIQTGKWDD